MVELSAKQIELLREMMPGLKRIAVLVMPTFGPAGPQYFDEAAAAAVKLGVEAIRYDVATVDDFERAFVELRQRGVDAVMFAPAPVYVPARERIAKLAIADGFQLSESARLRFVPVFCSGMDPIFKTCSVRPLTTWTASSRERIPPSCGYNSPPSLNSSSILRRRRHWAWTYRPR